MTKMLVAYRWIASAICWENAVRRHTTAIFVLRCWKPGFARCEAGVFSLTGGRGIAPQLAPGRSAEAEVGIYVPQTKVAHGKIAPKNT